MMQVKLAEAGTDLTKFVHMLQSGQENMIIITENGKPDVKMECSQVKSNGGGIKIGIAEGKLVYPDDIHAFDDEIAELFGV